MSVLAVVSMMLVVGRLVGGGTVARGSVLRQSDSTPHQAKAQQSSKE
jgi:hypothetical protein